jgi:hypothetical protein
VEALRAQSAAANEEAIEKARDWLSRELPAGAAKPKTEVLAGAEAAGVSVAALRNVLKLLGVNREQDEAGQKIWSRPEDDAHEVPEQTSVSARRVVTGEDGVSRVVGR